MIEALGESDAVLDAARAGRTVHRLLMKGADVNAADKDGRTPLHDAAPGRMRSSAGGATERRLPGTFGV
jgi:ankyrin repeat protein